MDEPVSHLKYEKYKRLVKIWEREFKQKNGRTPSKHDIRDVKHIRDAYKMYYKLKSSFLEDTLSQSLDDDDGFDIPFDTSSSQFDLSSSMSISKLSTVADDDSALMLSSILNTSSNASLENSSNFSNIHEIDSPSTLINIRNVDENHIITKFDAEQMEKINENSWGGSAQTQQKKTIKPNLGGSSSTTTNKLRLSMTDKLFKNANFTKRNPRKSLSRTNSQVSAITSPTSTPIEQLPDLETILIQKSLQQPDEGNLPINANIPINKKNVHLNVDKRWLDRCAPLESNCMDTEDTLPVEDVSTAASSSGTKFGISSINSTKLPVTVKQATSFGMSGLNLTQHSEQISSLPYKTDVTQYEDINDDDEIIANSEEDEMKTTEKNDDINKFRHILKKRRLAITNPIKKRTEIRNDLELRRSPRKTVTPTLQQKCSIPKKQEINAKNKLKSNYKTETITCRRSNRTCNKPTTKIIENNDEADEEIDPFCGDDSDADPDFIVQSSIDNSSTKSAITDKSIENKVAKSQKKSVQTTRKSKRKQVKETASSSSDGETEQTDEYVMEFGAEIKNVPQININDLKKTNEIFESYLIDVGGESNDLNSKLKPTKSAGPKTDREKMETKIEAGKLNENFVRINIQKKKFVRGKKGVNFSRYKKAQWKNKKAAAAALAGPDMDMRGCDGGYQICFQCGKRGHFVQNCPVKCDRLLPLDVAADEIEESTFPTLDQVEAMASAHAIKAHANRLDTLPKSTVVQDNENNEMEIVTKKTYIGHTIPEDFLKKSGLLDAPTVANSDGIQPIYQCNETTGELCDTTQEVYDALHMFGHNSFRKGQDRAIMRVLSGMSTLVTLSTGSGKSLCYQLPAYLYRKHRKCITLVISPLVSLMEDQVHGVPHFLNAQCLHTNQNKQKRQQTLDQIRSGKVDILLISPEAIVAGEKSTGFGSLLRELPPIAFVCIDEAHCVSQWSHNFRPSYLMICRVLKEKLKVKTVLGLTATATLPTRQSIVRHLAIPDGVAGVISDIPLPDNLILTISKDDNRDMALINLLADEKFKNFQSIIIYCTRRDECERIANKIRTCFQNDQHELNNAMSNDATTTTTKKRKRTVKKIVESYHAGMAASRRKTIQNQFMNGNLKIVVATIAFGMGINKADIRAIIHYNMPMTFESYVQEIGRAGRDGNIAQCHLFLDNKGNDKTELRRHIYANSIDRHVIRKLLQNLFIPCACLQNAKQNKEFDAELSAINEINWNADFDENNVDTTKSVAVEQQVRKCPGHEICFSIDDTVQQLDIPEENISTLLCYMELHPKRFIQVLSKAYRMCKVMSYGGANSLKLAAQNCPPLAMAIALDLKKGISHTKSTFIEFGVIEIAAAIGWDSGIVKYQLKNLEWTTVNGLPKRSNISVEFYDLGFRVRSPGDLSDEELDSTLDLLQSRVVEQEKTQLLQLQTVFNGLSSVAYNSLNACISSQTTEINERSNKLKTLIRNYFQTEQLSSATENQFNDNENIAIDETPTEQLLSDVRTMIGRYPENQFTGRAIARIFHGVQSPVYPALVWSRCSYWRAHQKTDFNRIVTLANAEIVKMRT